MKIVLMLTLFCLTQGSGPNRYIELFESSGCGDCSSHGQLVDGASCICDLGWQGACCEKEEICFHDGDVLCPGQHNICQQIDEDGGNSSATDCVCQENFCGENCSTQVYCVTLNPCNGQGMCVDSAVCGEQNCTCNDDWTGDQCETPVGECDKVSPCSGNGQCNDTDGTATCDCENGYEGETCSNFVGGNCANSPCQNGGSCTEEPNGYKCSCALGYAGKDCASAGDYCSTENACNGQVCTGTVDDFTCTCDNILYQGKACDIPVCQNITDVNSDGVVVSFNSTQEGDSASSQYRCSNGFAAGKPIATRKCGKNFQWEETSWINCTGDFNSLDPEEQAEFLNVITSDPSLVTADDVTAVVSNISTISESSLTPASADALTATVNNLLQVPEVGSNSQELLTSIGKILKNTELEQDESEAGLSTYQETESLLSLVALEASQVRRRAVRNDGSNTWSYSLETPLQQDDFFRGASFVYSSSQIDESQHALFVQMNSSGRVTFEAYADTSLFGSMTSGTIESIILRSETFEPSSFLPPVKTKFYLFQRFSLDETGYDSSADKTAVCVTWDETNSLWSRTVGECNFERLSSTSLYNFVQCSCNKVGYHAIAMMVGKVPLKDEGNGLSTGEIVGIVIGSVCGAILIIGGISYFVYTKNKKKQIHVSRSSLGSRRNSSAAENKAMELNEVKAAQEEAPKQVW